MPTVVVGSSSAAKERAVATALRWAFGDGAPRPVCRPLPSGVADQPWGDEETRRGARARARAAYRHAGCAGLGVGIEGGVGSAQGTATVGAGEPVWAFAWVAVAGPDTGAGPDGAGDGTGYDTGDAALEGAEAQPERAPRIHHARTAAFALPAAVAARVLAGEELGPANDAVYAMSGSKHGLGAVGLLTGGRLTRDALYAPAVLLALVPWLPPPVPPG